MPDTREDRVLRIDELTPLRLAELIEEHRHGFRRDGACEVRGFGLPATFEPRETSFYFVQVEEEGRCAVFLPERTRYLGRDPSWRRICSGPVHAGGIRRVASVPGDLHDGLEALRGLLVRVAREGEAEGRDRGPRRGAGRTEGRGRQVRGAPVQDLVARARERPPEYHRREALVIELKANLCRFTKPGTVILGEAGVGKTTIVEVLAGDIAADRELPAGLVGASILEVTPMGLAAGGGDGLLASRGNEKRVLFMDEIHQLAETQFAPLCDRLKPALASGAIRMIGATTPKEWARLKDEAFKRRFLELVVPEPDLQETYEMVRSRVADLEEHHEVAIDDGMVREAIVLAARHIHHRRFPDKALDLLDHAAALQALAAARGEEKRDA